MIHFYLVTGFLDYHYSYFYFLYYFYHLSLVVTFANQPVVIDMPELIFLDSNQLSIHKYLTDSYSNIQIPLTPFDQFLYTLKAITTIVLSKCHCCSKSYIHTTKSPYPKDK